MEPIKNIKSGKSIENILRNTYGVVIPRKSNTSPPQGGGGAPLLLQCAVPFTEGPTILSSTLEHVGEWSPARPGPPFFSPPGSPEEMTPAERVRVRSNKPPPLQRQPCLERAALLEAMGFSAEDGLKDPPLIQRIQPRLILKKGLQPFPPPEEEVEKEEDEEIKSSARKRYRVTTENH